MAKFYARGVRTAAFGDLFLEDLRAWREANLAEAEMCGLFPIWRRDTTNLAHEVIAMGCKAYLSCVEGKVGPRFVGRPYDLKLLRIYDGPIFSRSIAVQVGEIVVRDGRYYADLLPTDLANSETILAESIPPV